MALPSLGGWPAGRSSGRCNNRRILDAEIMPSLHQIPTVLRNVPRKCSSSSTQRQLVIAKAGRSRRSAAASVSSPSTFSDERAVSLDKPNAQASFEDPNTFVPEDYELAPGVLSTVNRTAPAAAEDAFKCIGCTKPECQGHNGCAAFSWRFNLDGYLREVLTARVYDVAVQSPLEKAEKLSDALGNDILLKREDLQPVFSFKLRGAFNKMAKLPQESLQRGVITSSAGNHAQGVALAAAKLGCKAVICMPVNTPDIKVANVKRLGGQVELVGESYQEAQAYAQACAVRDGLTFVAPYDDPHTIAGQGTIGDEILRQLEDLRANRNGNRALGMQIANPEKLDAIFVAIGGGGLIAGIAAYVKALHPRIKVIGVEPVGANAMAMSLEQGRRVTLSRVDAFADGVAVKHVGAETFRLCRELCDGVLLVDNASISAAIKDVFNETRSILEPAGAVAVAGAKAWLKENGHKGKTVVAITSGANINFERLRLVSELADIGARTEVMMATTIPERPGAFKDFVQAAAGADGDLNVTEFKYRFSAGANANILWSVGVKTRAEAKDALARLQAAGMDTIDVSSMPSAQIHLRHLVGGRARSYMGEIPNERIYQVQFPERPGALRRFLNSLSSEWNVTLFHYRNTGNQQSYVMLGLQVAPDTDKAFKKVLKSLQDEFTFEELGGEERKVFNMFIQ